MSQKSSKYTVLRHPPEELLVEISKLKKYGWLNVRCSKHKLLKFDAFEYNILQRAAKKNSVTRLTLKLITQMPTEKFLNGFNLALCSFKNITNFTHDLRLCNPNINLNNIRRPLRYLRKLQNLKLLFSPNVPPVEILKAFDEISSMRMLKTLSLTARMDLRCSEKLAEVLDKFYQLEGLCLSLHGDRVNQKLFSKIGQMESLKKISFSFKNELDRDEFTIVVQAMQKLKNLEYFSLSGRVFDVKFEEDVMELARTICLCPNLEFFKLCLGCDNSVKETYFKDFSNNIMKLKKLRYLYFELSNAFFINEEAFECFGYALKSLPALKHLTLKLPLLKTGWSFVTSISPVRELTQLKLDLFGGKILDASLKAFATSPFLNNLQHLDLILAECKNLTGEGLKETLFHLKNLKTLYLWVGEWLMHPRAMELLMKNLCAGLREIRQLTAFKLSLEGHATDKIIQILSQALKLKKELRKLKLDFRLAHNLTDKAFLFLADAISSVKHLTNLLIWVRPEPKVTTKGVASLIYSIAKLPNLHKLSLSWRYRCNSPIQEAEVLKRKLLNHKTLVEVDYGIHMRLAYEQKSYLTTILYYLILILGPFILYRLFKRVFSIKSLASAAAK